VSVLPQHPLARLRLRLTLWYVGVFSLILVLLGGGIFLAVRRQLSRQLDTSLRTAVAALRRSTRIREIEQAHATGPVVDAVAELRIPDRALYLFDANARPIIPAQVPPWILAAAQQAMGTGSANVDLDTPDDHHIRLHAERFAGGTGRIYVGAAAADRVELEDRYASLIEVFAGAALVALLLVAGGGYVLVRQSTAPVERSMEQMRRFMADAAHELRTPITILRTRAEVALGQERDAGADAATLRAIERETERLSALVGDLLTLARADAGERPMTRESVYLDDLAVEAVETIRTLADRHQVTVQMQSFEEARIAGDPVLVRRLLLILLDNAVKFTPEGGRVDVDVVASDGRRTVVIADTGPGIAPETLPRVFERFFRGEHARRDTEGSGLGLAIARWITDAHGAKIEIRSSPGEGTRVAVDFPPGL
jgi:signal transduction histidine kinase